MRKINYAKVFFGETRLKDIAVGATKWEVFKYRLAIWTKRTVIALFALITLYTTSYVSRATAPTVYVHAEDTSEVMYKAKIDELKDNVINEIAECESGNASQELAIVKYDNNSKNTLKGKHIASIGVMQFKVSTVQQFYKTLHKKDISNYEATMIALDNAKAKNLAKEAIFGIQGAVLHWTCASNKIIAKVSLIKDLEK